MRRIQILTLFFFLSTLFIGCGNPLIKDYAKDLFCNHTLTVIYPATCLTSGTGTVNCHRKPEHNGTSQAINALWHLYTTAGGPCGRSCGVTAVYARGDTGPGNGIIFYVADGLAGRPLGFTVQGHLSYDGGNGVGNDYTAHYLEAAPVDISGQQLWSTYSPSEWTGFGFVGTTGEIGSGRKNTAMILAFEPGAPAASACNIYSSNGQTDWFLPSQFELLELYRSHVGTFVTVANAANYWTSSEVWWYSPMWAYSVPFDTGNDETFPRKDQTHYVRPIRAF